MLCSRMLRSHQTEGKLASAVQRRFDALDDFYDRTVRRALLRRKLILAVTAATIIAIVWLFRSLPSELVPTEDRGTIVGVLIAPEGSTLDYTDRYMRQIEEIFTAVPERGGLFTAIGLTGEGPGRVTDGFFFLPLKAFDERERSQQEIVQELFPQLLAIPGVLAFAINPPSLGGQFSSTPVQYVLQAPTYDELRPAVEAMMAEASKLGYLLNLDTDLQAQQAAARDRDRPRAGVRASACRSPTSARRSRPSSAAASRRSSSAATSSTTSSCRSARRERATPRAIEDLYLRGDGRPVPDGERRHGARDRRAQGAEPLQPRPLGHRSPRTSRPASRSARRSTTSTRSRGRSSRPASAPISTASRASSASRAAASTSSS